MSRYESHRAVSKFIVCVIHWHSRSDRRCPSRLQRGVCKGLSVFLFVFLYKYWSVKSVSCVGRHGGGVRDRKGYGWGGLHSLYAVLVAASASKITYPLNSLVMALLNDLHVLDDQTRRCEHWDLKVE